jgi:hypothetical protein
MVSKKLKKNEKKERKNQNTRNAELEAENKQQR